MAATTCAGERAECIGEGLWGALGWDSGRAAIPNLLAGHPASCDPECNRGSVSDSPSLPPSPERPLGLPPGRGSIARGGGCPCQVHPLSHRRAGLVPSLRVLAHALLRFPRTVRLGGAGE
eukprot:15306365-Alexandrium_andersonii.AAC.1